VKTPCPDNSEMPTSSKSDSDLLHSAFYKFVCVTDENALAELLRELSHDVLGSILVAPEGINGMVAAAPAALTAFELSLTTDARLHGLFNGMAFKHSACATAPFQRMKVHSKPEVLPLGVDGVEAVGHVGIQLNPHQWRELMQQDDVVLIDNRNHFEFRLGRFKGAVDPQVHNFRDFPAWVQAQLPTWKAQKKRVAMYCTGGIRCEKTSAWMSQLGMPVLELEGGILNYFAQMPDAQKEWEGECFVFDNRVALNTRLEETGTRAEDVYGDAPGEKWRLERAQRLVSNAPVLTPSPLTGEGWGGGENSKPKPSHANDLTSSPTLPRQGGGSKNPLPTKNGVGPSCIVLPQGAWPTITAFLIDRFPGVSSATWQHRIQQGEVLDEHGAPITPQQRHQAGLKLYYYRHIEAEDRIPFEATVLFQDDLLVVADKPHFLPVTPGGKYLQETLLVRLKQSLGIDDLTPIHRLDRETAGVVMFCANPKARAAYAAIFAQRQVVKRYEAIVAWSNNIKLPLTHHSRMEEDAHFMRMREAPGTPNSETRIELMSVDRHQSHLRLSPVTGRKHQLRVHCAALGMPIVNDALYPVMKPQQADDFAQPLRLIARSIAFTDPVTGQAREFASSRTFGQPASATSNAST
jgi:tRNA pseudouridine32 synthase / 23S rRNA pseudouridine746 synthase